MSVKSTGIALEVISPERTLKDHAALISSLEKGVIAYRNGEGTDKVAISSGFVEINDNHVVACVEL